jgi:hypothetical protein
LRRAFPLLIVVVNISGVVGVLQLVGCASGPLDFFHVTNTGRAIRLIANRSYAILLGQPLSSAGLLFDAVG